MDLVLRIYSFLQRTLRVVLDSLPAAPLPLDVMSRLPVWRRPNKPNTFGTPKNCSPPPRPRRMVTLPISSRHVTSPLRAKPSASCTTARKRYTLLLPLGAQFTVNPTPLDVTSGKTGLSSYTTSWISSTSFSCDIVPVMFLPFFVLSLFLFSDCTSRSSSSCEAIHALRSRPLHTHTPKHAEKSRDISLI